MPELIFALGWRFLILHKINHVLDCLYFELRCFFFTPN
jgi:hypothetical protein